MSKKQPTAGALGPRSRSLLIAEDQAVAPEESVPVGAVTGGDGTFADEEFRAGEGLVLSVVSVTRCKEDLQLGC